MTPPYPRLHPALRQLQDSARHFWGDPAQRSRMLREILSADIAGDAQRLRSALVAVDGAVTDGMAALGCPRGMVRSVTLQALAGDLGLKRRTCDLVIGRDGLASAVARYPDDAILTWVHESIHGRTGPWTLITTASITCPGYEEGLAEGLAQMIARSAALNVPLPAYAHYVRGYELLAEELGADVDALYRRLWRAGLDDLRDRFNAVVVAMERARGRHLTVAERATVRQTADALFHESRQDDSPDDAVIRVAWKAALP